MWKDWCIYMKNFRKWIVILCLACVFVLSGVAGYNIYMGVLSGIDVAADENASGRIFFYNHQQLPLTESATSYGMPVYMPEGMKINLDGMPDALMPVYDGWSVVFTDVDHINLVTRDNGSIIGERGLNFVFGSLFNTTELSGECREKQKLAVISTQIGTEGMRAVTFHELGHALDYKLGKPSDNLTTDQISRIADVSGMVSSLDNREHIASSSSEAYAEALWLYVDHHDLFMKYVPDVCGAFDQLCGVTE